MKITLEAQWQDCVPNGKKILIAGLAGEVWPESPSWVWKVGREEGGWITEITSGVADDEAEAIHKVEVVIRKEASTP
jgi:hypothetical protein